jgi:hypothetical protein
MQVDLKILIYCSLFLFSVTERIDAANKTIFCRSGKILIAKITPNAPDIINISKYAPPSKITQNVAYATITMTLDKGRTIGIYDYVLKNKNNKKFPCIALKINKGPFDAKNWRIEQTNPLKRYTMLFKIEMPQNTSTLDLHFNLPIGKTKDIPVKFARTRPLTPSKTPEKQPSNSNKQEVKKRQPAPAQTQTTSQSSTQYDINNFKKGKILKTWTSSMLKEQWSKLKIKLPQECTQKTIGILFLYKQGMHGLDIKSVDLWEKGKQIAIDKHLGFAGHPPKANSYFLTPPQPIKSKRKCVITALVKPRLPLGHPPPDSTGEIWTLIKK